MNSMNRQRRYGQTYMRSPQPACNSWKVEDFSLAMAYVPWQHLTNTFDLCKAMEAGTLFPELYKPFCPKKGGGYRGR